MMAVLTAIFWFALAISPLVFFHELGHYAMGRVFGVKADAFSIGFGKPIAKWMDKRGTEWRLGWLPLGGYVKFAGDMNAASQPDPNAVHDPASLHTKPVWQRALIVAAGPLTNFLLAMIMLAGLFSAFGEPRILADVGGFAPHSSAQAAGMKVGDRITAIDGSRIDDFEDLAMIVQIKAGQTLPITVERGGKSLLLMVTPVAETVKDLTGAETRVGRIGVAPAKVDYIRPSVTELPAAAGRFTVNAVKSMATTLWQIVSGQRSADELGGPVKVAAASNAIASYGWVSFLYFMVMLSINLGFINLLPIPMLDGGHLALFAAEAVRGKPVTERVQELAFRSGLALLLAFTVFVTVNDLAGLGLFRRLAGLIG
ncbi:Zinc metalloprotease [Sphingomonas antarctica]|uniref:RIP metalloprotease RseP n=1 Tax=Sphingomonas antarctica TaxID=2040274 RepID=UPI0039EC8CAB